MDNSEKQASARIYLERAALEYELAAAGFRDIVNGGKPFTKESVEYAIRNAYGCDSDAMHAMGYARRLMDSED